MGAWPKKRIDELCEVTSSKRIYATELVEDGVPFLKSKEIIEKVNGQPHVNLLYISEQRFRDVSQQSGAIQEGDVLLTSRGTLGVPYVVNATDRFHFADGNLTWFRRFAGLDSNYFRYFLLSPLGRTELSKCVIGSSQQAYTIAALKKAEIPLPILLTQRRIASILSAYDDLIENSQRRIKILESMARALYREWFVHFRFPGYENHPRVASPLGEIPEGWEVKRLSELVTTQYGYTESTNESPVGPKYLRGMDMNKASHIDWSQVPYCLISAEEKESYAVKRGDVFVIRMADPGKVGIAEQDVDAVFASYLIRLRPKDDRLRPYSLFHLLDSPAYQGYISGASTGTTRKSASAGVITDFQFAMPPKRLIDAFETQATTFRESLTTLIQQIHNLRRTRDLLLPRLLSGQIALHELEAA
jgi:type I restriction enzyme S subunit